MENAHSENRADAIRLLKKRTGDAATGKPVGPELDRVRLDDLLAMVEADYRANSRKSLERVRDAAIHLRAFFRGDRKARDLTSDRISAYQAHRLEDGSAPATVNYELAVLRRAFRLAVRARKVGMRPEIQMLHVDNARKGFFEREQFEAVMQHLPEHLKPVVAATYITGWRTKSELLTRQWRHIDFANGWLRLEPGESKNGEGREFPFTPELKGILETQRDRVHEIERAKGSIIPWIFVHPLGAARAPAGSRIRDFRGAWAKACRDAGLPDRLIHDFRRTAVRNLERAGVPRSAAMRLTGHKTEAVYRRYAITDAAMLQEAAVKLAALHASEEKRTSFAQVTGSEGLAQRRPLQKPRYFT
jgi:integrase